MFIGRQALADVHAALEECWRSNSHVPERVRLEIDIAVGEIVANIVEHASRGEAVLVQMSIEVLPGQITIDLTDDGIECEVDPDEVQMPDELAKRGRGLAMARLVLSKLSYQRSGAHNHWRLASRSFA
ncbi:ATP-binding protein [Mycolicibacterium sp.]|uniref:ATP-binding protein n=1 Tax=Mycolicibacterium sp. TaxID=2320850 RepID=UPI0025F130AC|nr:ATP-binding protein [Mycolicibacterium sp.]MCB9408662.1 ATP-binding protein [Mycolicibacterium sp.]